jgi:hypothetical protein
MKKTTEEIKLEVHSKMLELHKRTYKFDLCDAHNELLTYKYRWGKIKIIRYK